MLAMSDRTNRLVAFSGNAAAVIDCYADAVVGRLLSAHDAAFTCALLVGEFLLTVALDKVPNSS
jgi:hypothetical protein